MGTCSLACLQSIHRAEKNTQKRTFVGRQRCVLVWLLRAVFFHGNPCLDVSLKCTSVRCIPRPSRRHRILESRLIQFSVPLFDQKNLPSTIHKKINIAIDFCLVVIFYVINQNSPRVFSWNWVFPNVTFLYFFWRLSCFFVFGDVDFIFSGADLAVRIKVAIILQ